MTAAEEMSWRRRAAQRRARVGRVEPGPDERRARGRGARASRRSARPDPDPDLATASGSGLDPHVSPAAARWQVPRAARARGLSQTKVQRLVEAHVEQPFLGLFGAPRVNVLALNVALDALAR